MAVKRFSNTPAREKCSVVDLSSVGLLAWPSVGRLGPPSVVRLHWLRVFFPFFPSRRISNAYSACACAVLRVPSFDFNSTIFFRAEFYFLAFLRSLATVNGSNPWSVLIASSVLTWTPRSAPMASAVRMVSPAALGPTDTTTISLAAFFSCFVFFNLINFQLLPCFKALQSVKIKVNIEHDTSNHSGGTWSRDYAQPLASFSGSLSTIRGGEGGGGKRCLHPHCRRRRYVSKCEHISSVSRHMIYC